MAFRIGQKVVCVKRGFNWNDWCPVKGDVYTIRYLGAAAPSQVATWGDIPSLRLEEIYGHFEQCGEETAFAQCRFRPLIEKSTDTGMAVLREILDRESYVIKSPAKAPSYQDDLSKQAQ